MTASSASPEPTSTPSLHRTGTTAAVIVTHRRAKLLRASLEQVVAQTHPVDWIIVVDNGAEAAVETLVDELAGER
ncbi:glycosyltransferase family 2 protein, partial [Corynebacterium propinquum]